MLRLLIDFRSYQISVYRGIGRYILGLTEAILNFDNTEISLLVSTGVNFAKIPENLKNKATIYTIENFDNYIIKENFDFLFKGNLFEGYADINFYYPKKVLAHCNDIVGMSHDLIPLLFPKDYLNNYDDKFRYASEFECLKYLSHIFCVSNNTKKDTMKFTGMKKDCFTTIYGGADFDKFHSKNSDKKYYFKDRNNNLVYIAGPDIRKNFHGAARVFAKAYETGQIPDNAKLYLICKSDENFKRIILKEIEGYKAKVGEQIIITDYIPDSEVVEILANAKASIMPSFYEGLGLPILESYVAGTPCFASNISSTKEFINEESSFDPYDDENFKNVIIRIYNDEQYCRQSLDFGRKILEHYNWENSAKIVIKKLNELKFNKKSESSKIAIFSILSIKESDVRQFNYKTLIKEQDKYDIFSDIKSDDDYIKLLDNEKITNIFPLNMYDFINFKEKYCAKIFVFGNNQHHKKILQKAIDTKHEKNRFLYISEITILNAFFELFEKDINKLRDFINKWYYLNPSINNSYCEFCTWCEKNNCFGIRPLVNLTGIKDIIINNKNTKKFILKELTEQEVRDLNINETGIFEHPNKNELNDIMYYDCL